MKKLKAALGAARTKAQYQRIQCLWLREALGLSAAQIAAAIGWNYASVWRLHSLYARLGDAALAEPKRGGRRRQNLTEKEEYNLLRQLRSAAAPQCVIHSGDVHAAYQKAVGHPVPPSTISRMLAGHGWTRHMIVAMANDTAPHRRPNRASPARFTCHPTLRPMR
ncbi:MAG TPA: helix-turn-helix domain-containing protein [Terriglobia bacterium]|nr:helix-turn-helix domain-containing protein [Terriglobia bacterium]